MSSEKGQKYIILCTRTNCITIIITLEGIEKNKTKKNDNTV